jgi:membrane protein implicated in regulation of membrane protease activity
MNAYGSNINRRRTIKVGLALRGIAVVILIAGGLVLLLRQAWLPVALCLALAVANALLGVRAFRGVNKKG